MGHRTERLKLIIAFAAIYLIWGSTYLGIRFAIETMPAIAMASVRFLIAGAALMAFMFLRGEPLPTRRQWRDGFVVGTLMLGFGTGAVTWAEQWVPSGLTALLVAAVPMWIVVIDWLRPNGVRPGAPVVAGLVIGFVGVGLLMDAELGLGEGYILAAVVILLGGVLWALGSIMSRHTESPQSQVMATGLKMFLGGISLAAAAGLAGDWGRFDVSAISLKSGMALAYLTSVGSAAFIAYLWLLKASTPEKASTYAYVNPAVAVILGTLLAGEPFTVKTAVASVVIIAAVLIVVKYRRKPEEATVKEIRPARERARVVTGESDIEAA